jgi:hypothetical protein
MTGEEPRMFRLIRKDQAKSIPVTETTEVLSSSAGQTA